MTQYISQTLILGDRDLGGTHPRNYTQRQGSFSGVKVEWATAPHSGGREDDDGKGGEKESMFCAEVRQTG